MTVAPRITCFSAIRADYPLSVHGVGLSIGGVAPLDREHLARLKHLIAIYQPALFSEHLAWSSHDGVFLNDLLPLPYNDISLAHVCAHVESGSGNHRDDNAFGKSLNLRRLWCTAR